MCDTSKKEEPKKNHRLTKEERNNILLTPQIKSILIGTLLSDSCLQKNLKWNPRICFKQSVINSVYLWSLYKQLSTLCSKNPPHRCKNKCKGKSFESLAFQTRQLACLNELFHLFYKPVYPSFASPLSTSPLSTSTLSIKKGEVERGEVERVKVSAKNKEKKNKVKYIKTIKKELIQYLDYLALAHWIMGDGSKKNNGLTLCTDNFTLEEVKLLISMLTTNFEIYPTIHCEKKKYYRIYINKHDLNKILPHIKPYILNHFLYKIS
jgi:uncharacterized protein YlbG (UPF0298 family)